LIPDPDVPVLGDTRYGQVLLRARDIAGEAFDAWRGDKHRSVLVVGFQAFGHADSFRTWALRPQHAVEQARGWLAGSRSSASRWWHALRAGSEYLVHLDGRQDDREFSRGAPKVIETMPLRVAAVRIFGDTPANGD